MLESRLAAVFFSSLKAGPRYSSRITRLPSTCTTCARSEKLSTAALNLRRHSAAPRRLPLPRPLPYPSNSQLRFCSAEARSAMAPPTDRDILPDT